MGQQMCQCHKDIIIYIREWRTMWGESSQSGKHVTCLGMGLMGTFSGPKSLAVQIFFNTLWVGLTNPHVILDSFNENPLDPNADTSAQICPTVRSKVQTHRSICSEVWSRCGHFWRFIDQVPHPILTSNSPLTKPKMNFFLLNAPPSSTITSILLYTTTDQRFTKLPIW